MWNGETGSGLRYYVSGLYNVLFVFLVKTIYCVM